MTTRTATNLRAAMEAEAYSNAKCSRFAAHARMNENHEVALLFQRIADTDRCEHFEKEFELAELTGTDLENFHSTVNEKSRQSELYSRFAKEALADGDRSEAMTFQAIRADELKQMDVLKESAEKLKSQTKKSGTVAV